MRPAPEHIRCFSEDADQLGESPFWLPESSTLWWVDIAGRAVRSRTLAGTERRWGFDEEPGCIAPTLDGRILVALRSGIELFDPRDERREPLCAVPYDTATTRCNDGRCDPAGRFWVGTVFEPKTRPGAALYRLDRANDGTWSLQQQAGECLTANGLAFGPDGRSAFWSNTPEHVIHRFDFDPAQGRLGARSEFRRFPRKVDGEPYGGRPDGAAVDKQGAYWVAMYEGGRVLRLAPDGSQLFELALPVHAPTMVCLGGPQLRTLFITTAAKGGSGAGTTAHSVAGHVLAVELDALGIDPQVCGLPVARFDPAA